MSWDEQISRIKSKIVMAGKKDRNRKIFGANVHRYELKPPIAIEEVEAFEQKNGIRLPEPYRQFLTKIGNGGAGPYYGLYGLKQDAAADEMLPLPCKLHPDLTKQEWAELTSFAEAEDADEEYDAAFDALFQGMIALGTQGCTYEMMLIVSGENQGRIVYIDQDLQKPFFTYESHFLDWYERWLDEIIHGYNLGWFGTLRGGDDAQLMDLFHQSNDEKVKVSALEGMRKLPGIRPETEAFLTKNLSPTPDAIGRESLLILAKNAYPTAKPWLLQLLDSPDEEGRLDALRFVLWYGKHDLEAFVEPILRQIDEVTQDENFKFMMYILEKSRRYSPSMLIPGFYNANKEIRKSAIYQVSKADDKASYAGHFASVLQDKEPDVQITAVEALAHVTDKALLPYYEQILKDNPSDKDRILTHVMRRLREYGTAAHPLLKQFTDHPDKKTRDKICSILDGQP